MPASEGKAAAPAIAALMAFCLCAFEIIGQSGDLLILLLTKR
jgi:hypothetical protein